ncbi:MAG: hypothetical protein M3442_16510 [Chloroflexota bacterium]|nr:hypothetical protein [Chloroflexota bacterium]
MKYVKYLVLGLFLIWGVAKADPDPRPEISAAVGQVRPLTAAFIPMFAVLPLRLLRSAVMKAPLPDPVERS